MNKTVKVIIPIYKTELTPNEKISLEQAYSVLNRYELVVIKPADLNLAEIAAQYPCLKFQSFDSNYFKGISGYNRLMLSADFYEKFLNTRFILIYQLDAYVFSDRLQEWCEKEYDYVGAPWLKKNVYNWPFISFCMYIFRKYKALTGQPSKQKLYNKVGNGGFSLRKVKSHYDATIHYKEKIEFFLTQKRYHLYNEDVFWATEIGEFKYPDPIEALQFGFDKYPRLCMKLNNNQLPFGCHGWYKAKMKSFWRKYISFN